MSNNVAAVIAAAGSGSRMGLSTPKQFYDLAGVPMLIHSLRAFEQVAAVDLVVVVVPARDCAWVEELVGRYQFDRLAGRIMVVSGGRLRQDSVAAGLAVLPPDTEMVVVHDGARPLVSAAIIEACLDKARQSGAAITAVPVKDTLKAVGAGQKILKTVARAELWQAQTPQAARLALLREAYAAAAAADFVGTDEAALLEQIGCPVAVVEGSERNIKITRPADLLLAEAILMHEKPPVFMPEIRVGHGYDAHRLVPDRPLVLGGVTVPHPTGLLGHSDADVLTHALCDAILGAIGAGDIGRHFPAADPQFKDIRSIKLLAQVVALAGKMGFKLLNADLTVIAQEPQLADYLFDMKEILTEVCQVKLHAINLKATTTEKMGFTGRQEGIAAHAVVLMQG